MENFQRDLAKEVDALQSSKSTRKNRHWTLMFVGDHGQVVTIRWFRWMLTAGGLLLVLAVLAAGIFYSLHRHTRSINVALQRSLDNMHQQVSEFRRDKVVLTAQLMVAESELKRLRAQVDPKPIEKGPGERTEARSKKEPSLEDGGAVRQDNAAVSRGKDKVIAGAPPVESESQGVDPKVSIEGFTVLYEADENTYRAQFIVRNDGPESQPVSGYCAIVLKKLNTRQDQWLTLPTLQLADGVPTGSRVGQYFSIVRFKTVQFKVKSWMDPGLFDAATVYVFDEKKNLLHAKGFFINIQEAVFTPNP